MSSRHDLNIERSFTIYMIVMIPTCMRRTSQSLKLRNLMNEDIYSASKMMRSLDLVL